jgi:hypothetical protein
MTWRYPSALDATAASSFARSFVASCSGPRGRGPDVGRRRGAARAPAVSAHPGRRAPSAEGAGGPSGEDARGGAAPPHGGDGVGPPRLPEVRTAAASLAASPAVEQLDADAASRLPRRHLAPARRRPGHGWTAPPSRAGSRARGSTARVDQAGRSPSPPNSRRAAPRRRRGRDPRRQARGLAERLPGRRLLIAVGAAGCLRGCTEGRSPRTSGAGTAASLESRAAVAGHTSHPHLAQGFGVAGSLEPSVRTRRARPSRHAGPTEPAVAS